MMRGYRVYCVGEGSVDLVDALTELGYVPAQPADADTAADCAELRARVAELDTANADTTHKLRVALTELNWARGARDEYAAKIDKQRIELRELRTELDAARTSVQQLTADRNEANGTCARLGYELNAAAIKGHDARQEITALREQVAALTAERDELAAKWAAVPWAEIVWCWAAATRPDYTRNEIVRDWLFANRPATPD